MISNLLFLLLLVSTALAHSGFGISRHVARCHDSVNRSTRFHIHRSARCGVNRRPDPYRVGGLSAPFSFGSKNRRMYPVRATLDGSESNEDPKALTDARAESDERHDRPADTGRCDAHGFRNELNEKFATQKELYDAKLNAHTKGSDLNAQQVGEVKHQLNKISEDFNEFKLSSVYSNSTMNSKIDSVSRDLNSKTDANFAALISKIDSLSSNFNANLKLEIAASNANLKSEIASNLKSEIAAGNANLKLEIAASNANLKSEMKSEIASNSKDLSTKIDGLQTDLTVIKSGWQVIRGILGFCVAACVVSFATVIPWSTFSWWPWKRSTLSTLSLSLGGLVSWWPWKG